MKLHRYLKPDGSFDYERYKAAQVAANARKLDRRWVNPKTIAFLADWLKAHVSPLRFGLCHGTRRGDEQAWFRGHLGIEVIGTEISPTATQFPHTIEWDFHRVKPAWIEAVDFVYSNSWDHSFAPKRAFTNWARCLRVGGVMLLEHSGQHEPDAVTESDPFGIGRAQFVTFLDRIGEGRFAVREVITELPFEKPPHLAGLSFVIVEKRQRMDGR
jgi:SAM-dependent methyltransferase